MLPLVQALGKVYQNDALCKERDLSAGERLEFHQLHSAPLMEDLQRRAIDQLDQKKVEPNSGLGNALRYMLKRWNRLTQFLRIPGAPLDNNLCEQILKRAVLNRKNSLFYRTEHGAFIGDLFMSLIHTCSLCGANPFEYLSILQRHSAELFKNPAKWLPWNYAETLQGQPP
jgi:transposase